MPRGCYPECAEKRDFMEFNPPRNATDFYREYDPMIGIGTAGILIMFFLLLTIKGLVRYAIRRWKMNQFYKQFRQSEQNEKVLNI